MAVLTRLPFNPTTGQPVVISWKKNPTVLFFLYRNTLTVSSLPANSQFAIYLRNYGGTSSACGIAQEGFAGFVHIIAS